MLVNKLILRAAGVGLAAIVSLAAQPLKAQASSDADRIEKLERAVQALQQRNAQLESEVSGLKKTQNAFAAAPPGEGKMKKVVTSDSKNYAEKLVPDLSSAEKWKLAPWLTELELFGDVRLRYEYRGGRLPGDDPNNPNDWQELERERYRLRIGLRGTVLDDWFFGVRLETSASARSTNVTFGDDTSTSSPGGGGPFAKGSDGIFVGQAYGGYKGFPGFTFTGGRMPNPFVTTSMVWDDDISPEGLAEQWKHTFAIGGGEAVPVSYSKDGKAVAAPLAEPFLKIDVFANFAQFVYDDSNPSNPIGPIPTVTQPIGGETQNVPTANAFMLGWQVGAKFDFLKKFYFQLAPTLYNYTGDGNTFNIHFSGDPGGNQTGINSLLVFDIPAEIGWKIGKIPMRIFGDFATNFDADDRATAAGHPDKGGDRYAYEIGLGIGQLKKKHDWEVRAWYQHQDQFALDPNLVDSDTFNQQLNLNGPVVRAGYMLADAVLFNLTWAYAWRIDDSLGTGGIGNVTTNPTDQYQLFQADLSFKF
jgi:Putative porin